MCCGHAKAASLKQPTGCHSLNPRRKVMKMHEPASSLMLIIVEVVIMVSYFLLCFRLDRIEKKIDEIRKR